MYFEKNHQPLPSHKLCFANRLFFVCAAQMRPDTADKVCNPIGKKTAMPEEKKGDRPRHKSNVSTMYAP